MDLKSALGLVYPNRIKVSKTVFEILSNIQLPPHIHLDYIMLKIKNQEFISEADGGA